MAWDLDHPTPFRHNPPHTPCQQRRVLPMKMLICGIEYDTSAPYKEGHVCNGTEAVVLNHHRDNALKLKFRKLLLRTLKGRQSRNLSADERKWILMKFAAIDQESYLEAPNTPSVVEGPTTRECLAIAKEQIYAQFRARGDDPTLVDSRIMGEKIAEASRLPAIIAEAERRLATRRELGESLFADVDIRRSNGG